MRTSKPIATISYNTVDFSEQKLAGVASESFRTFYFFIYHIAEEDEKDHIHLYIEPNTRIDTMDLQEFLEEPDPKNIQKPLRPLPFRACRNLDEWIFIRRTLSCLYCVEEKMEGSEMYILW